VSQFWQTPYRLGWMLLQALMQTARHADAVYVLFAIMLMNLFLSPPMSAIGVNPLVALWWKLLSFTLLLTLMTGWMQVMHSRTWLLMLDYTKRDAALMNDTHCHAPCLVSVKSGFTQKEASSPLGVTNEQNTPEVNAFITPLEDGSDGEDSLLDQAFSTERPVLMRPVKLPFFQGVARFWGRSVLLNFLLALLLLSLMVAPFAYMAVYAGVPELFSHISEQSLNELSQLSNTALKAKLMGLPRHEIQLLSQWAAAFCISMGLTLLGFLATALWWPTLIVWDVTPLQALGIQWQYLRRDYVRAIVVSSFQFGVLGFLIMVGLTRSGNLWLDAISQVAVFFAFLYGVHLSYIYIYSVTRPPFLNSEQQGLLQATPKSPFQTTA
jgi:hypothetical protein